MKILIVTALLKEQKAFFEKTAPSLEKKVSSELPFERFNIVNKYNKHPFEVGIINLGSVGNVEAAIMTTQAICAFDPDLIILSGICGGFKNKSLNLGDIIIPEEILYYEYGKISDNETKRRYKKIKINNILIKRIRDFVANEISNLGSNNTFPEIHFNPIASGEKVVADLDFQMELLHYFDSLIGIEMESYGTGQAAIKSGKQNKYIVVKSIADWADSNKNDDWHDFATNVSAKFVIYLIKNLNLNSIINEVNNASSPTAANPNPQS